MRVAQMPVGPLGRLVAVGQTVDEPVLDRLAHGVGRIEGSTWFDGYRRSFDAVWETATPIAELEGQQRQSLVG